MKLLVTGGAGFIGSAFVRHALAATGAHEVLTLDALTYSGDRRNLDEVAGDPRHRFVHGSITDHGLVMELAAGVDAIVNIAAETHVDRSLLDPAAFVQTNVGGTTALLDAARARGIRLVQVSTDEVYGDVDAPVRSDEHAPLRPRSPYAASKAAADHMVAAYVVSHGVDAVITRGCNTIGPRQYPEKLVPLFVARALQDEALPVYGDGRQVRDWLAVEDHVAAIWLALTRGAGGAIYNVAREQERENRAVVAAILDRLGKPASLITHVADRPGHDRRYAVDATRIREELGWAPQYTADEALARTIDWCAANLDTQRRRLDAQGDRAYFDRQYGWRMTATAGEQR
jgi:dTDP-glucose 4,6-dehydratase